VSAGAHLIGVDVGSQSVKGILCAPDGTPLASAAHPCTMTHPASGWAEQDPAQWIEGIGTVVRRLLTHGIAAREVTYLGLACQVDGVVPVDRWLTPLRPAMIWLDKRAAPQVRHLAEAVGEDAVFATTGLVLDASHTAPKMMWLREEEPEVFQRASLLPPPGAFVLGWLTGRPLQDHANASSSLLYDVVARDWAMPLLEASGIDPALLAPIAPAHEIAGPLRPEAAEALGLTTRCLVVVGTGDDHGAALGAGVVHEGLVADVTGTAEPVGTCTTRPVFDGEQLVETHAHALDGTYFIENPGFVSGGSVLWLASLLAASQADVVGWAGQAPPGADGVIFLPTLSGSTAPRWHDLMRGVFHGLSMNHGRAHLARAVLEGCAYALRSVTSRLVALGLPVDELRVVGGGARSELWLQMKADVCGVPARAVGGDEPTALGAAMLAAVGAGVFPDAATASSTMAIVSKHAYEPDMRRRDAYEAGYRTYLSVFEAAEALLT
jgi:xylulokinase